jgi:stearoyl-CoA desaturase (delta-9 desaturase)
MVSARAISAGKRGGRVSQTLHVWLPSQSAFSAKKVEFSFQNHQSDNRSPIITELLQSLAPYFVTISAWLSGRDFRDRQEQLVEQTKAGKFNWGTAFWLAVLHLGALAAPFYWSWGAIALSAFLWWLSGSLGIGVGFHRLLTHRGFKTPKWVEYFLTFCGVLALQSGPLQWVGTHRIHHAFTEREGDPHTTRDGFWWAHIGWMLRGTSQQHDDATLRRYAPDLAKDPAHQWLSKFYWLPTILLGVGLFALGGLPYLLWAVSFRIVFGLHATWLVNSATHFWGSRRFETRDDSTNSWWVALLTFGEGWHNNHHAYPTAAKHGLAWYEIDVNWWSIRTLQLLGLAKSIKLINLKEKAEAKPEADALPEAA